MRSLCMCAALTVAWGGLLCACSGTENEPDGTEEATNACVQEDALKVTKTATPKLHRTWLWAIDKVADPMSVTLPIGETHDISYDVTVEATEYDEDYAVEGEISIYNPAEYSACIEGVTDMISGSIEATVDCGVVVDPDVPYMLGAYETLTCSYTAWLPDDSARVNTATVETCGDVAGGQATADIDFACAEVGVTDECVSVEDTFAGALGDVCAGSSPTVFTYTRTVGPYEECGMFCAENTATFTTCDTQEQGSAVVSVPIDVPCDLGCTLTPGYWKTHSCDGPAPFDDTWDELGEESCDLDFFESGQSYLEVLKRPPKGNAYYILAHAWIAAELNDLNGADGSAIEETFDDALALFETYTPDEVGTLKGNSQVRTDFIALAEILDDYNNGLIGPGHCDD